MENVRLNSMPSKKCTKCGKILPTTEFHTNSHARDGLQVSCKRCRRSHRNQNYNTPEGKKKARDYRLDPLVNMVSRIRNRFILAMKKFGVPATGMTVEQIIGADGTKLIEHIETLFSEGMSWKNMDQWDLDHDTPICNFDLELESERIAAFHYTNLVPVWRADHKQKSIDDVFPIRVRQEKFLRHIEQNFLPGMSWDNSTQWFVDTRCRAEDLDLSKPADRRKFFHYTNYVPRWRSGAEQAA